MRKTTLLVILALTWMVGCSQEPSVPDDASAPPEASAPAQTETQTKPAAPDATAPEEPAVEPEPAAKPAEPAAPATPAPKVAGDLLVNGGFDRGADWWSVTPETLTVERDPEGAHDDAGACARIEVTASDAPFNLTQWVHDVEPGRTYQLRGLVRIEDLEGDLIIQLSTASSEDPAKRTFQDFGPLSGTQGWTSFTLRTVVPDDADTLAVIITSRPDAPAAGLIWVDEFSLVALDEAPEAPVNLLQNGGFEEGPLYHWENPMELACQADRVNKVRAGNQSLRVDMTGVADSPAYLRQWVKDITPGTTYEVSGWFRSENLPGEVFLIALVKNSDGSEESAKSYFARRTVDWRKLDLTIEAGDDAEQIAVQVYYTPDPELDNVDRDAECAFWVDQLRMVPVTE